MVRAHARSRRGTRAAEVLARQASGEADRFVDRYDTLLFLAGTLYDQIESSPAWHSEHLAVQRSQLNLTDELTQIATDTIALRGLLAELEDAISTAPAARAGLESRIAALGPVWTQLLDRVAALARIGDLLGFADGRMAIVEVAQRAASLDERIDDSSVAPVRESCRPTTPTSSATNSVVPRNR